MKSYIMEKTKEEAEKIAKDFYNRGLIKSFGEARKLIDHLGRGKDKNVYYCWEIECEE